MKLKFNQNSICEENSFMYGKDFLHVLVVTTMTKLEVFFRGKMIATAGVQRSQDFDYYALLAFAEHKSGSKINKDL